MFINNSEINKNDNIKIYNLTTSPISGITIYIASEDPMILDAILTEENNSPRVSLNIDNIIYGIKSGANGESSLRPITYQRNISICKLKITREDSVLGFIVGSNSSSVGDEWDNVLNFGDKNDYIEMAIVLDNISDPNLKQIIFDKIRIVIMPIINNVMYDNDIYISNSSGDGYGIGLFGLGKYGGI